MGQNGQNSKKENQRSRLTKTLLKNAYLDLMNEKKTGHITVTDLCERAELNRTTFYLHYGEPNDVLKAIEDEIIDNTRQYLASIGQTVDREGDTYILDFLHYIKANDKTFRVMLIENDDPHFRKKFIDSALKNVIASLRVHLNPETRDYIYSYLCNGSLAALVLWIESNYSLEEQTLLSLLTNLATDGIKNMVIP